MRERTIGHASTKAPCTILTISGCALLTRAGIRPQPRLAFSASEQGMLSRSLSDTFAGIRPQDAPPFVVAQVLGAACATIAFMWLAPIPKDGSDSVLLHHE